MYVGVQHGVKILRYSKMSHANIFLSFSTSAIKGLEDFIEKGKINGNDLSMTSDHVVALQYEPNDMFNGFNIHASDKVFKKNLISY